MKIVYVGQQNAILNEHLTVLGHLYSFEKIEELLAWSSTANEEVDKVLVVPGGFNPEANGFEEFELLQQVMKKIKGDLIVYPWRPDAVERLKAEYVSYENTMIGEIAGGLRWSVMKAALKDPITPLPVTKVVKARSVAAKPKVEEEPSSSRNVNKYAPVIGEYAEKDAKTIVVCSLSPFAGSTFIASNLATMVAKETRPASVVEYLGNQPALYEYLDGDKNKPEQWHSIASRIYTETSTNGRDYWKRHNVYWFALDQRDEGREFDSQQVEDLMLATKVSPYTFVDVSTNWADKQLEEVYNSCDEIWVVFRPHVPYLKHTLAKAKKALSRWAPKTKFVGNGFDFTTRSIVDQINDLISSTPEYVSNPENSIARHQRDRYVWKDHTVVAMVEQLSSATVSKAEWSSVPLTKTNDGGAEALRALTPLVKLVGVQDVVITDEESKKKKKSGFGFGFGKKKK